MRWAITIFRRQSVPISGRIWIAHEMFFVFKPENFEHVKSETAAKRYTTPLNNENGGTVTGHNYKF